MGRDVKRYFGDFHRFLSVGRLLFFPQEAAFGRPRPFRLARGARQPNAGIRRKALGSCWETQRPVKAEFFRKAAVEPWGLRSHKSCMASPEPGAAVNASRANGQQLDVVHGSGIQIRIPCAWDSRFVGANSVWQMELSWIWV